MKLGEVVEYSGNIVVYGWTILISRCCVAVIFDIIITVLSTVLPVSADFFIVMQS